MTKCFLGGNSPPSSLNTPVTALKWFCLFIKDTIIQWAVYKSSVKVGPAKSDNSVNRPEDRIRIGHSPLARSVVELVKTSAPVSHRSWVRIPPENAYNFFFHLGGSGDCWACSAYTIYVQKGKRSPISESKHDKQPFSFMSQWQQFRILKGSCNVNKILINACIIPRNFVL